MENKLLIKYVDVDIYQQELLVLKDVQLEIHSGEFVYLLGKVGSGKSTLLKSIYHEIPILFGVAGALGYDLRTLKSHDIPFLRRKIGIVFQDFQLLTDRTIYQNLDFVLRATGWNDQQAINEQIESVLSQVGMSGIGGKMPHQLSGGEQQRIVIARALLNSPEMILADEPTGNLDPETGNELVELLYNIRLSGTTVIMATHNLSWLNKFPGRVFRCEDENLWEVTGDNYTERKFTEENVIIPEVKDTIEPLEIEKEE
ncbi:MAG: ATP-binding cassette domain-containing protein [Bacteroidota bacterium]|nr:ATP-binding cassette domain-containing protein [Bacteroidota bacterium]